MASWQDAPPVSGNGQQNAPAWTSAPRVESQPSALEGIKGVPPVAPKNADAWFASQVGQPAQPAPGEGNFPDQPQALQPPERSILAANRGPYETERRSPFSPLVGHGYAARVRAMAEQGPNKPPPITNDELVKEYGEEGLGFYKGAVKAPDNLATAIDTGAKRIGINMDVPSRALGIPTTAEAVKGHQDFIAAQEAKGMRPGEMGKYAGEMATTLPMIAATGAGPTVGGAMYNTLTTDAKDMQGVARDALIGAVGGKAGDLALKGAGAVIAPKYSTNVQKLLDEGVKLTPGMIGGKYAKYTEDLATSVPITGYAIKQAQTRAIDSFNRAAVNRTLTPIGTKLPDAVATGHEAVGYAQKALGDAYDALLPNLTASKDATYIAKMGNLRKLAQNLPPNVSSFVSNTLDGIDNEFSSGAGKMSGFTLKDKEAELGELIRGLSSSSVGSERLAGNAIKEAQAILRETVERVNPNQAAQLKAINRGFANLVRIERAAAGAKGGIFTPGQLQSATKVSDSTVRKRASARGAALMQDLATAGRDILPSTVPDSGTPVRAIATMLAGGGGAAYVSPAALASMAAGYGAYTRPGQYALRTLLAARPQGAQGVRKALASYKTPAAITGAAGAREAADRFTPP